MRVFKQKYKSRNGETRDSAKWYVELKDHNETMRRLPGFTDKKATKEFGRRLEKLVALRTLGDTPDPELSRWLETLPTDTRKRLGKFGLLDSRTVANSKPLSDHLDDFHASLLHKGNTQTHADLTKARVSNVVSGCGFRYFSDIAAARVFRFLAEQRQADMSAQTSNYYLQAFKQFCGWMVKERRSAESPVAHLSAVNAKLDRRRERRNLSAADLSNLLEITAAGPVHHKFDGRARTMLYRVAMETGLRRKELVSLTPESLDTDSELATIIIRAEDAKNRKPTVQAIRRELAEELLKWIQDAQIAPETPLWANLTKRTADMLKVDLEAADIAYVDDAGLYADFHALRHSYISLIAQGGVHPKLAQKLARHSDINLTMTRYTHTLLSDESEALDVLPEFPSMYDNGSDKEQQELRATGTDDATAQKNVLPFGLPESGAERGVSVHLSAVSMGEEREKAVAPGAVKNPAKHEENPLFEAIERRERDSNPRSRENPTRRISNPAHDSENVNDDTDLGDVPKSGCTDGCQTSPENVPEVVPAGPPTTVPDDPKLVRIVTAWPDLPEAVKAGILAMVRAAGGVG